MNIGIYIYDEAEVLDFSGPFEVFSTASRISDEQEPFTVFLIGETGNTIHARGGYSINPRYCFDNHPDIDVLIVAGGMHIQEMQKTNVLNWIIAQSQKASLIASVCTGAFLLARAKILTNQEVTTHWQDIPDLKAMFPELNIIENIRWVDQGNIITSAGISAGIDMCLHLVSRLHSRQLADKTARQMDFAWTQNQSIIN